MRFSITQTVYNENKITGTGGIYRMYSINNGLQ